MRMSFSDAIANGVDSSHPRLIDKFELKISLGTLSPTPDRHSLNENDSFCGFINQIGRVSRNADVDPSELNHSPYLLESNLSASGGWIFNHISTHYDSTRDLSYFKLDVSKGSRSSQYPVPLFAGKMFLKKYSGEVALDFSFNATRYQMYNSGLISESVLDGDRRTLYGVTDDMRERVARVRREIESEYSLDGGDNYLPPVNAPSIFLSSLRHIRQYIDGVENAVAQELERASTQNRELGFVPVLNRRDHDEVKYTLDKCEVYFEFRSDAPAQTLKELAPTLAMYSRQGMAIREYEWQDECEELEGSPYEEELESGWIRSYIIRLPYNNSIAIYAKTDKRIRVEVRYDNARGSALPLRQGKTCADMDELYGKFERLTFVAGQMVNHLFAFIRSQGVTITESSVSVPKLIMDVHKHCNYDDELAGLILEQLAEYRSIRSMQGVAGSEIARCISNMKDRVPYVIEPCNSASGDGFYIPTEDYSWAVSKLGEDEFWQRCVTIPETDSERGGV